MPIKDFQTDPYPTQKPKHAAYPCCDSYITRFFLHRDTPFSGLECCLRREYGTFLGSVGKSPAQMPDSVCGAACSRKARSAAARRRENRNAASLFRTRLL